MGNSYADFVQIVAGLSNKKIQEVVVEAGSDQDKQILKKSSVGSYPMLELDDGTLLCDSFAIASYIARSTGCGKLLGSNDVEAA